MEQVTFTITKEEIQQYANKTLSNDQLESVLLIVENDQGLWSDIESSIKAAIESVIL